MLLLLVLVMLFGSYLAGSIPLVVSMSEVSEPFGPRFGVNFLSIRIHRN